MRNYQHTRCHIPQGWCWFILNPYMSPNAAVRTCMSSDDSVYIICIESATWFWKYIHWRMDIILHIQPYCNLHKKVLPTFVLKNVQGLRCTFHIARPMLGVGLFFCYHFRREHNVHKNKVSLKFTLFTCWNHVIINCFPFIDKFYLYRDFININEHEEYI